MSLRSKVAAVTGAAALLIVQLLAAAPASAAGTDGLWWYDGLGVGDAVAAGATGRGVAIGVIDGQVNPHVPVLAGADVQVHEPSFCATATGSDTFVPATSTELTDSSSHGTDVVAMIVGTGRGYPGQAQAVAGIAPKATVRFYATTIGDDGGDGKVVCSIAKNGRHSQFADAIVQAVDDGVGIISISMGMTLSGDELQAVEWALHKGVIIVAAMPNRGGEDSSLEYLNGVVSVEAIGPDLKPAMQIEGRQGHTDVMAPGGQMLLQGDRTSRSWQTTVIGQGNSFATPLVSGMLAAVWSKYPKATGNQILQSLLHNTGAQDHALDFDQTYGYGYASEAHMLRVDPTQYPDVNPLLTVDGYKDWAATGGDFTAAAVASATRPAWAPPLTGATAAATSSATASAVPGAAAPAPAVGSRTPLLWWALGAGVLLLVVLLSVTLRRRGRTPVVDGAQEGTR